MKWKVLNGRLRKIFDASKNVDLILIKNNDSVDPNFLYLTGFRSGLFENTYLLADRKRMYIITSPLEYETARSQKSSGMKIINNRNERKTIAKWLGKLMKNKRVGMNSMFLPYYSYRLLKKYAKIKKIVDISAALSNARLVKDAQEISSIKRAVGITKLTMERIPKYFREGMTELQLAAQFNYISMQLGSEREAFTTIVCFGENAAEPHHVPGKTMLRKGDFILIDAGAKVDNYCSDITRTFIFKLGAGAEQKKEMYDVVREAQRKAIAAIRVGVKGKEIHAVADEYINTYKSGKYRGRFIHGLGHSIGLEVHDGAGFSPKAEQRLEESMVITVEPGIYIPNFGGVRIEDDILITKRGARVL